MQETATMLLNKQLDKVYVLYHAHCYDGFTAAWIARKYFLEQGINEDFIECRACSYYQKLEFLNPKSHVYILDFSFDFKTLLLLALKHDQVVLLDHHKSAERKIVTAYKDYIEGNVALSERVKEERKDIVSDTKILTFLPEAFNLGISFDMERSGAKMAWDHFFGGEAPTLVKCVEDRDLWRFKIPYTKTAMAYIGSLPMTFEQWDTLQHEVDYNVEQIIKSGQCILNKEKKQVESVCEQAYRSNLLGRTVAVVNSGPYLSSEIGNMLCEMYYIDYSIVYWEKPNGIYRYSLRSTETTGCDVSDVALTWDGGGHKYAAGFESQYKIPFPLGKLVKRKD